MKFRGKDIMDTITLQPHFMSSPYADSHSADTSSETHTRYLFVVFIFRLRTMSMTVADNGHEFGLVELEKLKLVILAPSVSCFCPF